MFGTALLALAAAAQPVSPEGRGPLVRSAERTVRAARRVGPLALDGKLDEPAWQAAESGAGFTQVEPDEGKVSPVATRFRVLWDEESLYIGVECDDPEPVTAYLSRRDRFVEGDRIDIDLDTTLDKRSR